MSWYKNLAPESITSWRNLKAQFARHFTASRRHPKSEATLEGIIQGKDEPLRAYIERFNKEVVEIHTTDHMKKYLLEKGLRPNSDFRKAVGIETPHSLAELLHKAQAYIQYEEKEAAYKARDSRNQENSKAKKDESEVPRRDKER